MKQITQIEKSYMKDNIPDFNAGDTVKVHVKIKEGDKERVQVFQGTVISRRGGGIGETFTVRKISSGIGVERIFPLHSPNISKIQRVRQGKVHQAKLYYLRGLTGKSARITEKLTDKENDKAAAKEETKAETRAEAKVEAQKPAKKATKKAAKKAAKSKKAETTPAAEE